MAEAIQTIENPIYSLANRSIGVGKDTSYTLSGVVPPVDNPGGNTTGTRIQPSTTTTFRITQSAQSPLHMANSALAVNVIISDTVALNDSLNAVVGIPWNLFGNLIGGVTLKINDSSNNIYTSNVGMYRHEWTAYMLTTYDIDALNNHSAVIGPVGAYGDNYVGGPAATLAGSSITRRAVFLPSANTHTYICRLICPLADLLTGFPAFILKNMRKMELTITWGANPARMLESAAPGTSYGYVSVVKAEMLTSLPVKSATQFAETAQERAQAIPDIVAFSKPNAHLMTYTHNSSLIINSVKNMDKVFIYQPGDFFTNRATRAATSTGQFYLLPLATTVGALTFDYSAITDQAIDTVSIMYGSQVYPSNPIEVKQATVGNYSSQLYYEYLKAVDAFGAKDVSPLPEYLFKRIMPFICMKPNSTEAITLDNAAKDLQINIRTPSAPVVTSVVIIVFTHNIYRINADGTVSVIAGDG